MPFTKKITQPPDGCPNGELCTQMEIDRSQWHLSREVSITHIIATGVAAAGFVVWAMAQERRMTKLEEHAIVSAKADEDQVKERKELRDEIKVELREIRRLIEKQLDGKR